jgi:hypothetical protein
MSNAPTFAPHPYAALFPMNYRAYIRSEAWRRKRTEVIRRARGMCERCGRWPIVNVHHLSYARLGDEPLTDLIGACSRCHRELHGRVES